MGRVPRIFPMVSGNHGASATKKAAKSRATRAILVGAPRFELGTSCAQGRRATRLRYAPTCSALLILKHFPILLQSNLARNPGKKPPTVHELCTNEGYCTMTVHNPAALCDISLA